MAQVARSKKEEEAPIYKPKDALGNMVSVTMIMGGAGLTLSAIQNALTRQNVGAWGVFTRTGGSIGLFGAVQQLKPTWRTRG